VAEGVADERIDEAGVKGAKFGKGDAEAGVVGCGQRRCGIGEFGGIAAAPVDGVVDGGGDALGVVEALNAKEVVISKTKFHQGVRHF